ncbi:MAG: GNAT family N-acetyltransferase [Lachnospiraceae bacterium]|nr:GNAT family N-acetyltransferase [Lachnospiraceae bacterium]
MIIKGDKIYLRSITYEDTSDIVRWRNSDFVRDRFIYRERFTEELHNDWMKNVVETGKAVQFIMFEGTTGKKFGSVYLRDIDMKNKKCEFGIFIGEEEMSCKGYGREAALLITEYAFNEMGINRIFLRVLSDNEIAIRSYQRSGFTVEGTAREDVWIEDRPRDVLFMSKLKKE